MVPAVELVGGPAEGALALVVATRWSGLPRASVAGAPAPLAPMAVTTAADLEMPLCPYKTSLRFGCFSSAAFQRSILH